MTAVVSRRATAITTTDDDDRDNLENGQTESPNNTSKHLAEEEDDTKKVKQQKNSRNRLYYLYLTWILPRWKLKLVRIAFAMYPYLIMFEKGFPDTWDAYELTKLFSRMAAYIMYPDLLLIFLSKCR